MEHRNLQRLDVLLEHVVNLAGGDLLALLDEPGLLHGGQQLVVVLVHRVAQHLAKLDGPAARHRGHRAEVDDSHLVAGQQHEVAGVRVTVHHPQPARCVVAELEQPRRHQVPLLLGAVADDVRQRNALDPFLDDDLRGAGHDVRHHEMRIAFIGFGERALIVGLEPVVQFHLGALDQLVDDALHIGARRELLEHTDHALHRLQVGAQRLVGAGILDLDRDLAAVGPHRLVHLADAGRGDRLVVERREPVPPFGAQLRVEDAVDLGGGHRRCFPLQLRQRLAVGLAVLLGDGGFHDRQGLADLHRAALELAQDGEQLLGSLVHQFGVDLVLRLSGQTLPEAHGGPPGHADRQRGQFGVPRSAPTLDVAHHTIIHDCAEFPPTSWQRVMSA